VRSGSLFTTTTVNAFRLPNHYAFTTTLFWGVIVFLLGLITALNPSSLNDVLTSLSTKKTVIAL